VARWKQQAQQARLFATRAGGRTFTVATDADVGVLFALFAVRGRLQPRRNHTMPLADCIEVEGESELSTQRPFVHGHPGHRSI
jgi:hypothetical protein